MINDHIKLFLLFFLFLLLLFLFKIQQNIKKKKITLKLYFKIIKKPKINILKYSHSTVTGHYNVVQNN